MKVVQATEILFPEFCTGAIKVLVQTPLWSAKLYLSAALASCCPDNDNLIQGVSISTVDMLWSAQRWRKKENRSYVKNSTDYLFNKKSETEWLLSA